MFKCLIDYSSNWRMIREIYFSLRTTIAFRVNSANAMKQMEIVVIYK
jgi:hypothetical protein